MERSRRSTWSSNVGSRNASGEMVARAAAAEEEEEEADADAPAVLATFARDGGNELYFCRERGAPPMSSEGGRPSSDGESVGLTREMNGCVVLLLPPELELDADMGTAVVS